MAKRRSTIFRWHDKEAFAALLLRQLTDRDWANDLGLSMDEVREFVGQTAESAEALLSPGEDFQITYEPDQPVRGQFRVSIQGRRRDPRGAESFYEIGSFTVNPAGIS